MTNSVDGQNLFALSVMFKSFLLIFDLRRWKPLNQILQQRCFLKKVSQRKKKTFIFRKQMKDTAAWNRRSAWFFVGYRAIELVNNGFPNMKASDLGWILKTLDFQLLKKLLLDFGELDSNIVLIISKNFTNKTLLCSSVSKNIKMIRFFLALF